MPENTENLNWICVQLGSREHYAIPRSLAAIGRLRSLISDSWIPRWLAPLVRAIQLKKLAGRYHEDLRGVRVRSFTLGRLACDAQSRLNRLGVWPTIIRRNEWFEGRVGRDLQRESEGRKNPGKTTILFSYSYTARRPFELAKKRGWRTILGQVDPGPFEWEWVHRHTESYRDWERTAAEPPAVYWKYWREEVALADIIVANSEWSRQGLIKGGVPAEKIQIVPLVYEPPVIGGPANRTPNRFSSARKLQVLFLGQIVLRKGVGQLFEAARELTGCPVTFTFAGPMGVALPKWASELPNVTICGPVTRREASRRYLAADLFVLPTLSDGFALTQLEALAHGVPCVVSRFCGAVVKEGQNGIVLDAVTPQAIVSAVTELLKNPDRLAAMKRAAALPAGHGLADLGRALTDIENHFS